MSMISVKLWKTDPTTWTFLVWRRAESTVQYRPEFYALDGTGKVVIVTLTPTAPTPGGFICNPFSESPPTKIEEAKLVHAPFFASEQDREQRLIEPWEAEYHKIHGKTYTLNDQDDDPLSRRLKAFQDKKRIKMQRELAEAESIGDEAEKQQRLARINEEYMAPRRKTTALSEFHCAGLLNLMLQDIKDIGNDICYSYMLECWCRDNQLTVDHFTAERQKFKQWLKRCAVNVEYNVNDMRSKTSYKQMGLDLTEEEWEVLKARTLYRVVFKDDATAYLSGLATRTPSTIEEFEEVEKFKLEAKPKSKARRFETNENFTYFKDVDNLVSPVDFNKGNMPLILKELHDSQMNSRGNPDKWWRTWGELRKLAKCYNGTALQVMSPYKLFMRHSEFFSAVAEVEKPDGHAHESDAVRVRLKPDVEIVVVPTPPKTKLKRGRKPRKNAQNP